MDYKELVRTKIYDEMTKKEIDFCKKIELDYYKNKIEKLRQEGIKENKIAAYIYDLWQDYLIADDVELAEACNISDYDWAKGLHYYWFQMKEENPLKD